MSTDKICQSLIHVQRAWRFRPQAWRPRLDMSSEDVYSVGRSTRCVLVFTVFTYSFRERVMVVGVKR